MHTKSLGLTLVAGFILALGAACGGVTSTTTTTASQPAAKAPAGVAKSTTPRITPAAKLEFKAHLTAANHAPIVDKNWPITVTVTDLSGKPIAATLGLDVVTPGFGSYQVDNGKVYHFVGRHNENITWPGNAVGFPLKLQALVTVKGQTAELLWPLTVRKR